MESAAAALASHLASGEPWPPVHALRLRNLLLDACGSDHRALVELLLRVGRHGIADALRALGTVRPDAWPAHRTRLVARACGELFIGAEIAAWAVDAWAVALSVVPATTVHAIQRSYEDEARRAARERERAEAQAAAVLRSSAALAARTGAPVVGAGALAAMPPGTGRLMGTPGGLLATPKWGGTAATLLHTPSWAGGAAAPRVGAWRRGRGGPPRWRVSATPLQPPDMRKFFALFAVVAVCMFGVVTLMRRLTPALSVPMPIIALPESAQATVNPPPMVETLPTAADSANTADTADTANIAADVPPALPRTNTSPGSQASRPAPVASFVSPAIAATPRSPSADIDLVTSGIGGLYEVQHRVLSVHGNGLCDPVAESLARRQHLTVEEITHTPGESTFALATRTGVVGRLQPDGVFATSVHRSIYDNVRIVFRMTGRFTRDGFVARTTTETDAVIKYRVRQQCLVLADLVGRRRR
jgi:hypothetical protein